MDDNQVVFTIILITNIKFTITHKCQVDDTWHLCYCNCLSNFTETFIGIVDNQYVYYNPWEHIIAYFRLTIS